MGLGRVLVASTMIAFAVMLGSGTVRLSRLLVMLGGFRVGFLRHDRLHLTGGTYVLPSNGLTAVTVASLAAR